MADLPTSGYLTELARDAGALALYYYRGRGAATEYKADQSVVTEADRAVERLIHERIARDWPGHGVMGEEGAAHSALPGQPTWVIDPIDGTTNFAGGVANWAISIGVVVEGRPRLGALYLPVSGDLYAVDDEGCARWNDQPIEPNPTIPPERQTLLLTTNQHRDLRLDWPGRTLCMGAVAIDLCLVARGVGEAVVARPYLWDVAAGLAVLLAAGGSVVPLDPAETIDYDAMIAAPRRRALGYWVAARSPEALERARAATTSLYRPKA